MRGGSGAWAWRLVGLVALLAVVVAMPPPAIPGTFSVTASASQVHAPIYIEGDANFTKNLTRSGVSAGGAGTAANPYVIQGWNISAGTGIGIWIRYTTAFFVLRDVRVHDGNASYEGIYLQGVSNGTIDLALADGNREGIRIDGSKDVTVTGSTLRSNQAAGMVVLNSRNVRVQGNTVTGGAQGAILMKDVSDVSILANHLFGARYGVWLYGAARTTVSGNEARHNFVGISLNGTTGIVTNNTLFRNSNTGIEATSTGPVDITWNNVSANGVY